MHFGVLVLCVWTVFSEPLFSLGVSQWWWLNNGRSTDKGGGRPRSPRPRDRRGGHSLKKIFFQPLRPQFGLKSGGPLPWIMPLLSQFIAFLPSPFHISTDLLSVAGACFLLLHMGTHDHDCLLPEFASHGSSLLLGAGCQKRGEVWHHITMLAKFLDYNNGEL